MKKKKFFILICFAVLITSILSPIASNEYVRFGEVHDAVPHIAHVIQAKAALDQGEFPVKTAPLMYNHYGYPVFQFYNPVYYTVVGALYKWVTPQNPYIALKISIWLSLLLGTLFFYKLIFWFLKSDVIAFLSAILYVMSPYLLINIFERGDIPEAVAQGILPVVLYYSLKIFFSKKLNLSHFSFAAIAWCVLAGTHILTFIYFSLFLALFLLLFTFIHRDSFKNIILVGLSYAYALFLGCFFLLPVGLFVKYMNVHGTVAMAGFQFETLLPTLLSMTPTSPMPLPGNGRLVPGMKLYMSLGLPVLLSVGSIIYILFHNPGPRIPAARPRDRLAGVTQFESGVTQFKNFSIGILIVFLIAFFAVWTPFDFWSYLPKLLQSAQFTWRLLTETMWTGTILFAFAVMMIFGKKLDIRHALVGIILICVSLSPWITSQETGSVAVSEIIKNPDLGYGRGMYLVNPESVKLLPGEVTNTLTDTAQNCSPQGKKSLCHMTLSQETNIVQLPAFYYPNMLNVKVNGHDVPYFPTKLSDYTLLSLKLPRGTYTIEYYFQGMLLATVVSACAWILLVIYFIFRFLNLLLKPTGPRGRATG